MMKKQYFVALVAIVAIFGSVSLASAGAYGDADQPTELPAAPPPAPPVVPTPPVVAAPAANYSRPGRYLIGAGSYALEQFSGDFKDVGDDTFGFNVRAGKRVNDRVAVEVQFESFDDFSKSDDPDIEAWALTANAKIFAMTGCVQPYLLIGAGMLSVNEDPIGGADNVVAAGGRDTEKLLARLGLGTDVYVTENIAVTGDATYLLPTGDIENFNAIAFSLGLMYRF
ncbi:MAG: hypothetical protein ACI8TX_000769 [Hyphomicrobiaceae bacterium]|jgi:hypothetical protein